MSIKSDHNMIVALIKANYHIVDWETPTSSKWDVESITKATYKNVLLAEFKSAKKKRVVNNQSHSAEVIDKDTVEALNSVLEASTKKLYPGQKQKKNESRITSSEWKDKSIGTRKISTNAYCCT